MQELFLVATLVVLMLLFSKNIDSRQQFLRQGVGFWILVLSLLKICFVLVVLQLAPGKIFQKDALRYFFEISSIAFDPSKWEPLLGHGAWGYVVTPKMGMSYLYGLVAHVFGASPVLTVFSLNIFFSGMLALCCVLIVRKLTGHKRYDLFTLLIANLHPELFYWNTYILRETLANFLVVSAICCAVYMLTQKRSYHLLVPFLLALWLLNITRVQLVLLVVVFVASFAGVKLWLSRYRMPALWGVISFALFTVLAPTVELGVWKRFFLQFRRAAGSASEILRWDFDKWYSVAGDLFSALPRVLTLTPQISYGWANYLMVPFSIFCFFGVILYIAQLGRNLNHNKILGGSILVAIAVYVIGIAAVEIAGGVPFGIRFRTPIIPLLIVLSVPAWAGLFETARSFARAHSSGPLSQAKTPSKL